LFESVPSPEGIFIAQSLITPEPGSAMNEFQKLYPIHKQAKATEIPSGEGKSESKRTQSVLLSEGCVRGAGDVKAGKIACGVYNTPL
jgi:hypothetical protein